MSFSPVQDIDKTFVTLVRGSSVWNDTIESNTDFLEYTTDVIKTKNQDIPMFAECCVAYENVSVYSSSSAVVWRFGLKSSEDQYKCGQMRGWRGGSYFVGDDKCIATHKNTFTYSIINYSGYAISSYTVVPSFSSTLLFFPEVI